MAYSEWKNAGINLILLGTVSSYDLKTNYATYGLMATDYLSLTSDNFIVEVTNLNAGGSAAELSFSGGGSKNSPITKTYNNVTGVLTIGGISTSGSYSGSKYGTGYYNATLSIKVYIKY